MWTGHHILLSLHLWLYNIQTLKCSINLISDCERFLNNKFSRGSCFSSLSVVHIIYIYVPSFYIYHTYVPRIQNEQISWRHRSYEWKNVASIESERVMLDLSSTIQTIQLTSSTDPPHHHHASCSRLIYNLLESRVRWNNRTWSHGIRSKGSYRRCSK